MSGFYFDSLLSGGNQSTRDGQSIAPAGSFATNGILYLCPAGRFGSVPGLSSSDCSGLCHKGYYCPGMVCPQQALSWLVPCIPYSVFCLCLCVFDIFVHPPVSLSICLYLSIYLSTPVSWKHVPVHAGLRIRRVHLSGGLRGPTEGGIGLLHHRPLAGGMQARLVASDLFVCLSVCLPACLSV